MMRRLLPAPTGAMRNKRCSHESDTTASLGQAHATRTRRLPPPLFDQEKRAHRSPMLDRHSKPRWRRLRCAPTSAQGRRMPKKHHGAGQILEARGPTWADIHRTPQAIRQLGRNKCKPKKPCPSQGFANPNNLAHTMAWNLANPQSTPPTSQT